MDVVKLQTDYNNSHPLLYVNGYIFYNPAQDLKGVVSKVEVNHRPALELEKIPELLERIDNFKGRELTKLAIKLTLLIFIRSSELRFAPWSEIDFDKKVWTIPAEREVIDGVPHSHRGSKIPPLIWFH